jgi:bacillithiol system protein YtxJ
MIDVIAHRPLSMEAAHRLQIGHESPQAIAIVDGEVVWSGSHWEVTTEALAAAIGVT